jgi:hypothetical protein
MQSGESEVSQKVKVSLIEQLADQIVELEYQKIESTIPFASKKANQLPKLLDTLEQMQAHAEEARGSLLYPHLTYLIKKANELVIQNLELTRRNDEILSLYIKETIRKATLRY